VILLPMTVGRDKGLFSRRDSVSLIATLMKGHNNLRVSCNGSVSNIPSHFTLRSLPNEVSTVAPCEFDEGLLLKRHIVLRQKKYKQYSVKSVENQCAIIT